MLDLKTQFNKAAVDVLQLIQKPDAINLAT
jgi:hypothetical protein